MKFSSTGVSASSKQGPSYLDVKPIVKRVYGAFGADRMIWGELGTNMPGFDTASQLFASMFDFTPEADRAKVRGGTARKLFRFA